MPAHGCSCTREDDYRDSRNWEGPAADAPPRPRFHVSDAVGPRGRRAATALHTWINKKPSDLKLLIMIFGSNGLSHNALVYEKCLRAHVDHRKLHKDAFVAMMVMRFHGVIAPAPSGAGDLSQFKG